MRKNVFVISFAIITLICSAVAAADSQIGGIADDLNDNTKIYSVYTESPNGVRFATSNLGSYTSATYLMANYTEDIPVYVTYKLDNMRSFLVKTLRINPVESQDLWFYVSADDTVEGRVEIPYEQVTRTVESLGASWNSITFTCDVIEEGMNYLTIKIQNTDASDARRTRLDFVQINTPIDVTDVRLKNAKGDILGENIFGATSIEIAFNQAMDKNSFSQIEIIGEGETVYVNGVYNEEDKTVTFEFEPLKMGTYKFILKDAANTTGNRIEPFVYTAGLRGEINIPDFLEAGDSKAADISIYNADGTQLDTADISIDFVSDNEEVLIIDPETNTVTPLKSGRAVVRAYFTLEGIESEVIKTVTVRGLTDLFISAYKDSLYVGEGVQTVLSAKNELGQMVDIFGATILYASDNEQAATVSEDGHVRAVGVGVANITATIKLANVNYTSNTFAVSVGPNNIDSGYIVLPKNNLYTGEKVKADVMAFYQNKVPCDLTDYEVTFTSENTNVVRIDSSGEVTAVGEGITYIYATIQYSGGSIATERLKIYVGQQAGGIFYDELFDWSKVFYKDPGLILTKGLDEMYETVTNGENIRNQKIIWKLDSSIKSIKVVSVVLEDPYQPTDLDFYLSADNEEYIMLDKKDFRIIVGEPVAGWREIAHIYEGDIPEGMFYLKVNKDFKSGNTQKTRIRNVSLGFENIPSVMGVSLLNANSQVISEEMGLAATSAIISFAQPMNVESLQGAVELIDNATGKSVSFIGNPSTDTYDYIISFEPLDAAKTYTIKVSGAINSKGKSMAQDYTFKIEGHKKDIYISSAHMEDAGGNAVTSPYGLNSVTVVINVENIQEPQTAIAVAGLYDRNGTLKNISVSNVETVQVGTNQISTTLNVQGCLSTDYVLYYVWDSMTDIQPVKKL